MYRPASRSVLRAAAQSSLAPARTSAGRRFASTSPVSARRSWKSSALRWGIAVAGIYYYNTSPVFAEQPQSNLLNPSLDPFEESHDHSSLEELTSRRSQKAEKNAAVLHSAADAASSENASTTVVAEHEGPLSTDTPSGAAALEQEAESEGAFNPVTGEINWDCPCLGGMAYGPCGPEFKEAFSCFVFSTEEPKGMDCIDKFQNMQQCFQRHPEVYKGELEDDEELDAELEGERQELVKEIAERKAQLQEATPQRRLLEEPAPAAAAPKFAKSANKSTPKAEKQSDTSHPAPSATEKPPAPETKTTSSDQPPFELSSDKEAAHEGPNSAIVRHPKSPPVQESAVSEGDLIPKAAHDARGSSGVPEKEPEK